MIVLDASATLELLLKTARGQSIALRVLDPDEELHAPCLLDIEVTQVLRRHVHLQQISADRAAEALAYFSNLPIQRHPHLILLGRVWQLRRNLTAYDAIYVALAEALKAPLVTCDRALKSAGRGIIVEVF